MQKGGFDDIALNISPDEDFFGKHCNNVDFPSCIMIELKYFFSTLNYHDKCMVLLGRCQY